MIATSEGLEIWCIYRNPSDFPGKHVVRRWLNERPDHTCYVVVSLEEARKVIPKGKVRLDRAEKDDPCIVETWI